MWRSFSRLVIRRRKKYDVLYVHDGQNLFDKSTAFGGAEWEVDERVSQPAQQR
jgi:predicted alpha/beta superfamily hydrolase